MPGSTDLASPAPFIVGTGRCGTTLLRVMLDAHPDLAIPPESYFIPVAAEHVAQAGDDAAARFLAAVRQSRNWASFALDEDELRRRLDQLSPFDLGAAIRTVYDLYAAHFGKSRWGDKTPDYHAHMQVIARVLPEARFIHLIRDGRDVALSVLPLMSRSGMQPSVEDGARWWAGRLRQARRQGTQLEHYLEIRYESLAQEPEQTLRRICEFIELPWDPIMINYAEPAAAAIGRADYRSSRTIDRHVRKLAAAPPTPSRIQRWRTDMTADQRARVEAIIGPLLGELGYD